MNLLDHLSLAKESIFRFEYLQDFSIPGEQAALDHFEKTGEIDITDVQEWWDFLATLHARGVATERVRLVREPQNVYTRHELLVHKESVAHGDDIRVLAEGRLTPEVDTLGDFWLIDNALVLKMNYTTTGEYLGFEEVVDTAPYISAKEYLLARSTALI